MLPSFLQRGLIVLGIVTAGWLYAAWVLPWALAADGAEGFSLLLAASPVKAVGGVAVATLIAVLIGAIIGGLCGPLAGVFTVAGALGYAALRGGTIEQWLRGIESSSAYFRFAAEAVLWCGLLGVGIALCLRLTGLARRFLPGPVEDLSEINRPISRNLHTPLGVLVSVALGWLLTAVLMQSSDSWQVIWSLLLAFCAAGLAAHQLFPRVSATAVLLSPLLVAVGAYLFIAVAGGSGEQVLVAHFQGRFWHVGLALPIHYASAGVAGAAMGLGWSRALSAAREAGEIGEVSS